MHELSVASAIVDTVIKHADGRSVSVVSLRLGTLRQVVPKSLSFYFEIVGRDTVSEGARLELEMVDALMACGSCEHEWDPAPQPTHGDPFGTGLALPQFRCPECEAAGAKVIRGDELEVESIEVEEITPAESSASRPVPPGPATPWRQDREVETARAESSASRPVPPGPATPRRQDRELEEMMATETREPGRRRRGSEPSRTQETAPGAATGGPVAPPSSPAETSIRR